MNREQAVEIQRHALVAADAMNAIEAVVLGLPEEERSYFARHLGDMTIALPFGILKEIYDRFPDLRIGHEEEPEVSSTLQWKDVRLPESVSVSDLDELIFSKMKQNWRKTAVIVGDALHECVDRGMPIDDEVIGARIAALADARRIESQGNLSMWRHSEVRLLR